MQHVALLLLSSMSSANCFLDFFTPRVYDGVDDTDREFPYTVSLQMNYHPYLRLCTGNLLSDTWVVTAGHCIYDHVSTVVRYGEFTKNATKTRLYVSVVKSFRHPGFYGKLLKNDIALMLIDRVPVRVYAKLLAVDYRGLLGLPVKFAGFGKTSYILPKVSDKEDEVRLLQKGEGVIITCPRVIPVYGPAVCVAPKCANKLQGTRPGDSGGPLVLDGRIIGVLSASETDTPISYYTPLSVYLEWIRDVMNGTYFYKIN